jgi:hypothetical protein
MTVVAARLRAGRTVGGGQEAPFWARAGIKCAVSGSGQRGGARLVW